MSSVSSPSRTPLWIPRQVVLTIHDEQLAEHGGGSGIRDVSLLESALGRPKNLLAYGAPDIASLAASYAFGIARNHPFVDGNKRTSFVVCELFLNINGFDFLMPDEVGVVTWLAMAAGEMTEDELAERVRSSIRST